MARFDVYANPDPVERRHTPFVLDVQNDHLGPMASRVMIPLRTPQFIGPSVSDLNPQWLIEGKTVVLDTANIAAIHNSLLRRPVTRLDKERGDVLLALDTLFGSF